MRKLIPLFPISPLCRDEFVPQESNTFLAIFDHDGVLVDTLDLHQKAWLELGKRTGLPITADLIHQTFGMTNPSIFRLILNQSHSPQELAHYSNLKESCYRELANNTITLMAGVLELLDSLTASGVLLAIGSSAVRENLDLTIAQCALQGRFKAISSLEDIERGKPDPQVFLVAAAKAGVPPSRTVVFEDAVVGVQAAKAAGMRAVGVTNTHNEASLWKAGADEVVTHLKSYDVPALIKSLRHSRSI